MRSKALAKQALKAAEEKQQVTDEIAPMFVEFFNLIVKENIDHIWVGTGEMEFEEKAYRIADVKTGGKYT